MLAQNSYLSLIIRGALVLAVLVSTGCEPALNANLGNASAYASGDFDSTEGKQLPYALYAPSSMVGWQLDPTTQFQFDDQKRVYVIDKIPLGKPLTDEGVARFKICSSAWRHQFGFGEFIADQESTFAVGAGGVVLSIDEFPITASDMRFELPDAKASGLQHFMRIEFKWLGEKSQPQALMRVSVHP